MEEIKTKEQELEEEKASEIEDSSTTPIEEETKVEELTNVSPIQVKRIEITKPKKGEEPYYEVVEEKRKELLEVSKKGRIRSTISMIIVIIFLGVSVALLGNKQLVFLSWIFLGCAAFVIFIFWLINKRIDRPDVRGYIRDASTAINRYTFDSPLFSDVYYDPLDKLDISDVMADGLYKDITNIASRNVVEGKYHGRSFRACELALYSGLGRKQHTIFVGKYLTLHNDLNFEGKIVMHNKLDKDTDLANDIEDLKVLYSNKNFSIYGAEHFDYRALLGKEFLKEIEKFELKKHLLAIHICIQPGRTFFYCSYDDATITLPFYEEINKSPIEQYKKDLVELLDVGVLLLK